MGENGRIELAASYVKDLQDEVALLKAIARKAAAILSDDDSIEQIRRRYHGLRDEYDQARAAYLQRFGRSAP